LINQSLLEKFDAQGMHKVYDVWPEISREHFEMDLNGIDFGEVSHVVFAGMGGSGAISDVFSSILSKTNIHVEVIKGYLLPKTIDSKSLIITTSISGNTEETLNVLKLASDLKCKVVAFSDNGKMQKFCEEEKINHRKIPMIHSPRASFPSFLFSMLRVLEPFLPINRSDILDSIDKLEKQRDKISSMNLNDENSAISLAKWISGIPLIYYPWGLQAASIRFKNALQENAKMHAISEDIIEACHNGIVSWDKPSVVKPLLIQGEDDFIKTKERWRILKEFFNDRNMDYKEVNSVKGNILSKLINLIYLLDYTTIYRAVLSETNPTPVGAIDFVKKRLVD
jgi:glucose/mannose-6-phosphate isomerase